MRFLVTGGAGFIGSALIRHIIDSTTFEVLNLDKLTYAGNLDSLASVDTNPRYSFEKADICNKKQIIFLNHRGNNINTLFIHSNS